jgi:hypothetical protein
MLVDGRVLVVKVPPDFSGQVVEGQLTPLPEDVRASLGGDPPPHPWLLDAHEKYRLSFNLFVLIFGLLTPLVLLFALHSFWKASTVDRHSALARLKPFGSPQHVTERIEGEITSAGQAAKAGPLWVTPSWVVTTEPSLNIFPAADLVAIGHEVTAKKSGEQQHKLRFWNRGRLISEDIEVSAADARLALQALAARFPGIVVEDAKAYERRWSADRAACEKAAKRIAVCVLFLSIAPSTSWAIGKIGTVFGVSYRF